MVGDDWMADRWLQPLRDAKELRLARRRGKVIQRKGWVRRLQVRPGLITAEVADDAGTQNSVKIRMDVISPEVWEAAIERMAAEAGFAAELMRGRVSESLAAVFEEAGTDLFPFDLRDLHNFCSCRHAANVCSHAVATHFEFSRVITADPTNLLHFRGREREVLMAALRDRRQDGAQGDQTTTASGDRLEPFEALADGYWDKGVLPRLAFRVVTVDLDGDSVMPVLRALGPGPGNTPPQEVVSVLAPLMRTGKRRVDAIAEQAGTPEEDGAVVDSTQAQSLDEVLIAAAHQHGYLTSGFVAEALGISPREARQYLQWLVEEGRLAVVGRARGTRYVLPEAAQEHTLPDESERSADADHVVT